MLRRIARLVPALAMAFAFAPQSYAQANSLRIDSGHSVASISLVSSTNSTPPYNVGIAEVMGWVNAKEKDPAKSTFEFFIYPARQGPNLFDEHGNLRFDSYADLSRYSFLSFKSKNAVWGRDGKLELTGDLILTHVEREPTMNWSIAYSGPTYSEPETDRIAREVTFVIETSREALEMGFDIGHFDLSAMATIKREDFPGLWTALKDSVWPVVVLDRDCQPPDSKPDMRDFRGFQCTGTVVPVTPRTEPRRDFNANYPGPPTSDPPAGDAVTILVHLKVVPPR